MLSTLLDRFVLKELLICRQLEPGGWALGGSAKRHSGEVADATADSTAINARTVVVVSDDALEVSILSFVPTGGRFF